MNEVEKMLIDGTTAYMTPEVIVIFKVEPSYDAIAKAREILDSVTDTLLLQDLNLEEKSNET